LFFLLGIIATRLKSDLEILPIHQVYFFVFALSIGFRAGRISAQSFYHGIIWAVLWGTNCICYSFIVFLFSSESLVLKFGAIAAAYGSVSAVTFVTAVTLEMQNTFSGHMVAVMALMEACDNHWCNFN
jgi:hypothetical protein